MKQKKSFKVGSIVSIGILSVGIAWLAIAQSNRISNGAFKAIVGPPKTTYFKSGGRKASGSGAISKKTKAAIDHVHAKHIPPQPADTSRHHPSPPSRFTW